MIDRLPSVLVGRLNHDWEQFTQACEQAGLDWAPSQEFTNVLFRVWASSRWLRELCLTQPQTFMEYLHSGDLHRDYRAVEYRQRLQQALATVKDESSLMQVLREFRRREMFRIAWRDLAGWASLTETLRDLSLLADACIDTTLARLYQWHCRQWGTPKTADGRPMQLVVLGMGKLGAYELNFSSDIDLMFTYAEDGQTRKRNGLSHEEFFSRLGQQLINVLDQNTADGFVFRVDMRLRPYGDSGVLAISFDAMEEYYQYQGREWERYAMIKARVVAGDVIAGRTLMQVLRPFTYRRYLDYSAFESLRNMKGMIARQVERKGMEDNIKLGPGGIREIEFIGQAFQLIRGGREPELQVRGIVPVLKRLGEINSLPVYVVRQLLTAYDFLRRSENHLQAYGDHQVHKLPREEEERLGLAVSMGFNDWDSYLSVLQQHRQVVQEAFEQVMAAPQASPEPDAANSLAAIWQGAMDNTQARELLQKQGYQDPNYVLNLISSLHDSAAYRTRSNVGQERMDRLMPLVLGAVTHAPNPDECLLRVFNLLEAIAGRSTYLALLVENPMALSQLVRLFSASGWIAEHLTHYPILLDELLDPRSLYVPLEHAVLKQQLREQLAHLNIDDLEQQMELMRVFKQTNVLHVAAADLTDAMTLMKVSDCLTDVAEVILNEVLTIARRNLVTKHGSPICRQGRKQREPGFVMIGYGKLGGIELGYGSDLDLVFLHDSTGDHQVTTGPKVVDNPVLFARLGQRIIHMLNTHTAGGVLYEVDMRLRPSGASGLLVSDLEAFRRYQLEEAWTWEHQALVRARPVAGDESPAEAFRQIRAEVLCRARDPQTLQQEVVDMRERMRKEMGSKRRERFHLKQDAGGIADIEFMVQYLILRWAYEFPQIIEYTDNIRQLEALAGDNCLPADDASTLIDTYQQYRNQGHHQVLRGEPDTVEGDAFAEQRRQVVALWQRLMLEPPV